MTCTVLLAIFTLGSCNGLAGDDEMDRYFQRSDTITLSAGDAKAGERRHPHHQSLAAERRRPPDRLRRAPHRRAVSALQHHHEAGGSASQYWARREAMGQPPPSNQNININGSGAGLAGVSVPVGRGIKGDSRTRDSSLISRQAMFTRSVASVWRDDEGSVLIEATILMPFLVTLMFGLFEFSWYFHKQQLVESGVRDAARYLARVAPRRHQSLHADNPGRLQSASAEYRGDRRCHRRDGARSRLDHRKRDHLVHHVRQ